MILTMRAKLKWGLYRKIIMRYYRVNLRAEAKRFTQTMQSMDTMSIPQDGGGGISPIRVGKDVRQVQNIGQAKFLKKI